jgi:LuxR family maltose regulon positive regulatory protein
MAHARTLAHRSDPGLAAYIDSVEPVLREMFFGVEYKRLAVTVVFAEASLENDDAAAAERWIAEAEQVLKVYPDGGMLRGRAERLRRALEQRRLADPLTPAEWRVLDLLPTQLTAAQIAARLFLSTNTVKSHMRRLYAKLDVTTRTAAVERARALGLLRTAERA